MPYAKPTVYLGLARVATPETIGKTRMTHYVENALKAIEVFTKRTQPHLPHGDRLKFTTGLANSIPVEYHPRLLVFSHF
jgi:hypothetical protein